MISFFLINIVESIDNIEEYTKNGRDDFIKTRLIQDGVVRNLEIIGEATKHVSRKLRNSQPDIPWGKMAGLRDVLIHDYMGVDLNIIWNIVRNELPGLKLKIKSLM